MNSEDNVVEVFPGFGLQVNPRIMNEVVLDSQTRLLVDEDNLKALHQRYPLFLNRQDPGGDIITAHARTYVQYVEVCGIHRDEVEDDILRMAHEIRRKHRQPWWSQ